MLTNYFYKFRRNWVIDLRYWDVSDVTKHIDNFLYLYSAGVADCHHIVRPKKQNALINSVIVCSSSNPGDIATYSSRYRTVACRKQEGQLDATVSNRRFSIGTLLFGIVLDDCSTTVNL